MSITGAQYDALVKLMRGKPDSPASQSARLVMVAGVSNAEAARETGASRTTVHITVNRMSEAHAMVKAAYSVRGSLFTPDQYDALVKLMRGKPDTAASKAARLVIVDGLSGADAARETGATRSTVHITVGRMKAADDLIRSAYKGRASKAKASCTSEQA